MTNELNFNYVLGEKDTVLLVILTGKITGRETELLEAMTEEISKKTQPIVIFSLRDLESFMPGGFIQFAKLQKGLRDQKRLIGIASLRPEIKKTLLMAGIIRESEIFNNIPEAWKKLSSLLENQKLNKASEAVSSNSLAPIKEDEDPVTSKLFGALHISLAEDTKGTGEVVIFDDEEAQKELGRVLEQVNIQALLDLAHKYKPKEWFDRAIQLFEGAKKTFPQNADVLYFLALSHHYRSDGTHEIVARQELKKALSLNPSHPEALKLLAQIEKP